MDGIGQHAHARQGPLGRHFFRSRRSRDRLRSPREESFRWMSGISLDLGYPSFCFGTFSPPGLVVLFLSPSILFDQRPDVAGWIFAPCNDGSAASTRNPLVIGLQIRLVVMLETNAALSEFLGRFLEVFHRELRTVKLAGCVSPSDTAECWN